MHYPLRPQQGEPRFDTLAVLKLDCARSVPVNLRIFAQAQLGRTKDLVFAKIWSFENDPAPETALAAVFEHGAHSLRMEVTAKGCARLLADGNPLEGKMSSYLISGEDLQGEYWGAVMMVSSDVFFEALGLDALGPPAALYGNALREHPFLSAAALPPERIVLDLG